MSRKTDLDKWLQELEEEIQKRHERLRPELEELDRLREQRSHVKKLLVAMGGQPPAVSGDSNDEGSLVWKHICDEHNWPVGNDSAHRVVRRKNPSIHASISHYCTYDKRRYP